MVATSCEVITKYVQYGALAAPTLMRIMIKLRTARAQQRIEGLTYFKELLSSTSFSSMYIDCILPLREALGGLHKSHNERNKNSYVSLERPSNDITSGVENVYHYVNNIGGCPPGLLLQVRKCFQDLFKVLVGLLEDATSKGYSENSSFVQVLLDTLTLDYQPMDHKLLHSSGLIRCLHRCLSISTVEKTAKAWYEKYNENWQPAQIDENSITSYLSDKISSVFGGAAKTERFTWNPWPPHVVRHALISGKLSIRELVCKIRETPPNLLDLSFWRQHRLLGSLHDAVESHTISSILEVYDQSVKFAMHKQLHATMSEAEISTLGKQCVRVQAVFRGLRARQKVSLLRDGIDSEAPKGLSETLSNR